MGTPAAAGESPVSSGELPFCQKEQPSWWEARAGTSALGNGLSLKVTDPLVALPCPSSHLAAHA